MSFLSWFAAFRYIDTALITGMPPIYMQRYEKVLIKHLRSCNMYVLWGSLADSKELTGKYNITNKGTIKYFNRFKIEI